MSGIKLWIDDLRNPDAFGHKGWHWAKTNTEAIRILDELDVIEVSLDHDISHAIGMAEIIRPFPCPETFEPVARFLTKCQDLFDNFPVTIHSANPVGAEKMRKILDNYHFKVIVKMAEGGNKFERGEV